ncbi:hypothetical protein EKO04_007847 [Ascochyta lentis]|uniref:Uncharacterized protein n=1 Tax=Ascochyta lentis TaxID=205686 RepID=A0A8H7J0P8_9PLEO|nr:hypothetical protein EKO04_007847 [Ascochyta lentis]
MSTLNSPRLPGVQILHNDATGAEYSRWRRGVKFACETKGTWGFCDGSQSMPMPKAGSRTGSPRTSNTALQPSLLDERRAWVRQDREVKLDIFLSLSEEVMEEVLHASSPLPPSNMNAQEMLTALDRRFTAFRFEEYHHAFCHFLNLHMDQYSCLDDFNLEFRTTLEDLRDYGHPLSNIQACSAYFSKLRCTQNPWVVQKLEEWDTQSPSPKLEDLMKQSIPWTFKPSTANSSPNLKTESIPEDLVDDSSSQSDTDGSSISTSSSPSKLHSRQTSNTTAITTHSLEITIHASSEDVAQAIHLPRLPATRYTPAALPSQLSPKKSMPLMAPLPPINRPLPPLPKHILHASPRARSASPRIMVPSPKANISSPKSSAKSTQSPNPQTPCLRLETTHPSLRPKSPTLLDHKEFGPKPAPSPITPGETKVHPALRQAIAPTALSTTMTSTTLRVTPPLPSQVFGLDQSIAVPWPNTPDRPTSSRADLPSGQTQREVPALDAFTRLRAMSGASSTTSLPLTGTRAISPPRLQDRPLLKSTNTNTSPPLGSASPPKVLQGRTPTFESLGVPRCSSPDRFDGEKIERSSRPVRGLVARLSGDSLEVKEEKDLRKARKKSWSMGVSLGRFGPGKGVREIV